MKQKPRSGFGKISVNGISYLFNWSSTGDLVIYDENDKKSILGSSIWFSSPDSEEYKLKEQTWHGKHKKGPEWGVCGKRQAREMILKWKKLEKI